MVPAPRPDGVENLTLIKRKDNFIYSFTPRYCLCSRQSRANLHPRGLYLERA
jgi:hypothetical protein